MTAGIRSYNTDRTILNNIIQVQRTNTGGTGKHYAMTLGGTGAGVNPPGLNSNRNILRANLANGVVCLYGSVECAGLASWQTASGQDAGSLTSDPLFAAPSAAVPDLYLSAGQTSPAQGLGVFVTGITTDFDGDLRSLTAPDAGADEKITVLPVVWGEIRARRMDTYNLIEWTTLTELDVAGYNTVSYTHLTLPTKRIV